MEQKKLNLKYLLCPHFDLQKYCLVNLFTLREKVKKLIVPLKVMMECNGYESTCVCCDIFFIC